MNNHEQLLDIIGYMGDFCEDIEKGDLKSIKIVCEAYMDKKLTDFEIILAKELYEIKCGKIDTHNLIEFLEWDYWIKTI